MAVEQESDYVGLPVEEARALAVERGWELVRLLEPDALITMEYREGRLNFTVREGVVERCWTG
ncbi:I78 family peptidase inhibitor [Kitasatospora atroaurantiaca]|uniref:Peptidase inhibitor I78 family protein n=1 Tax=Kitasatospora atroaurantiaca TaxID=285545 RepID=A0A561EKL9_9ACTN|nr:I78 family peptidase inhibitor [Kitasatospora atroaurantiaca]TWE16175.1 peptidase inhibitor I78 family protein [Kitasatospora atroaurantiaca]